jgi:hypothetical protein
VSRPESTVDPVDPADAPSGPSFLRSVEFLTGPDPNLGSFLLVVAIVTAVFVALFQFTLPAPVSHVLTVGVLVITLVSAAVGAALDRMGYFDVPATGTTDAPSPPARRPWVPVGGASAPLPPLVNFDAELRAYADLFGGDLPPAFDPFVRDYLRLKTNTRNRATIASDLRADLNPIGALFDPGTEGDRLYESISDRLFRYVADADELVDVRDVTVADADGTATDVTALRGGVGRVAFEVVNGGEAAAVDAVVTLYDADGTAVSTRTRSAGVLGPGARRRLDVDAFVPGEADRAEVTVRASPVDPE